jgi:hypothetical protein
MATQRTWVLFQHDQEYGKDLVERINSQFGSDGTIVAESSAPYDEMLSLADSKRAMAEVEKAGELRTLAGKLFNDMQAERDKAREELKVMREQRDDARGLYEWLRREDHGDHVEWDEEGNEIRDGERVDD